MKPKVSQSKLTSFVFLLLFINSFVSVLGSANAANITNNRKLILPEKIIAGFEDPSNTTEVIVKLFESKQIRSQTNWHSQKSLKTLQADIEAREEFVLSDFPGNSLNVGHRFKNLAGFSATVTPAQLQILQSHPMVESIEPVIYLKPHLAQGIPLMNGLEIRNTYSGQGVAIAICDTGIDYTHPNLGGGGFPNSKVIGGYDFGDNDTDPAPNGNAHGTACAGIAAGALGSTGDYIGGVACNAKLYALKITQSGNTSASSANMVAAWDWCVSHKNDDPDNPILVISMSFGSEEGYSSICDSAIPSLTTAAQNAVAAGITVLVSSGNEGYCDAIGWPACISNVVSVGAVFDAPLGTVGFCVSNQSCAESSGNGGCGQGMFLTYQSSSADVVTAYSNTASILDVLAPSHDAYTTDIVGSGGYSPGDYDTEFGGTSAACPYAAGSVAIIQSAAKDYYGSYFTPQEIKDILIDTGDNITDDKVSITKPRINIGNAIGQFTSSPPVAEDVNVLAAPGITVPVVLSATDDRVPNPPGKLTYIVTSLPGYGSLSDSNGVTIVQSTLPYTLSDNTDTVQYLSLPCFIGQDSFTFQADDSGQAPDGGLSNTAVVAVDVQTAVQILYQTDFESGFPSGWTIVDGRSDGKTWTPDNPGGRSSSYWTGNFMVVDSDNAGHVNMDEELITQSIDCSNLQNVTLSFSHYFHHYSSEIADVDIRVAGGDWQNVASYTGSDDFGIKTIPLASANNQSDVQIRWHYYNANYEWYWGIDNIELAAEPKINPPAADLQYDCTVNYNDFVIFSAAWLSTAGQVNFNPACDIADPNNSNIDLHDLIVFLQQWLTSTE